MLLQHSTVLDKFIHFCTFFNSKSNNLECAQKSFLILHVSWYVYLMGTQMRSDKKYLPHARQKIKSRTTKVHCFGFSVFWSSVLLGCRFFRIQQESFIFTLTCRLHDVDSGIPRRGMWNCNRNICVAHNWCENLMPPVPRVIRISFENNRIWVNWILLSFKES